MRAHEAAARNLCSELAVNPVPEVLTMIETALENAAGEQIKERDEVSVKGHIVSIDGNYATVAWDSTTISSNVPLSKMIKRGD